MPPKALTLTLSLRERGPEGKPSGSPNKSGTGKPNESGTGTPILIPMTTETPPVDPVVEAWSDRLEDDLVDAGMDQPQARAYRYAFELGMHRLMSVVATKQELLQVKHDLQREMDHLRQEMRDLRDDLRHEMNLRFAEFDKRLKVMLWGMALGFGIVTALLSAILAIVA